jgi:NADH-quinone oxidoreductase subunit N
MSLFYFFFCLLLLYKNTKLHTSALHLTSNNSIVLAKLALTLISFLVTFIIRKGVILEKINSPEYNSLFLLGFFSLLLMLSSENFIIFYLLMEMQALCFYILAAFNRNSVFSIEGGLKYFIAGSFISGFYLLGCVCLYFSLGTLDLKVLLLLTNFNLNNFTFLNILVSIGLLLIIFSLLFKLACAPFHFWAPDVYDGSPLSSVCIFSVLPKLPLFFFFIKLIIATPYFFKIISIICLFFGIVSIFVGTFYAFKQKRLKRLIIYSSIAQTGFLVVSIGVSTFDALSSTLFFLFIYLITSLLIWGHLICFNRSNVIISDFLKEPAEALYLSNLSNMRKTNSVWSFSIVLIMFSIAGIPPLVGFLAKALIILQLIDSKNLLIASMLIIISAVSVYYYIRLIKVIYFEPKNSMKTTKMQIIFPDTTLEYTLYSTLLLLLIVLFFFPNQLLLFCHLLIIDIFQ